MELPRDVQERLERRWLARLSQDFQLKAKKVLNESEVTDKKSDSEGNAAN
jgi:hypothetical protein